MTQLWSQPDGSVCILNQGAEDTALELNSNSQGEAPGPSHLLIPGISSATVLSLAKKEYSER